MDDVNTWMWLALGVAVGMIVSWCWALCRVGAHADEQTEQLMQERERQ